MIDEELYQQAADELNTDRRRPHIWARACALASDDHDEARYLYTNLRVEELIAERDAGGKTGSSTTVADRDEEHDRTLALEPLDPSLAFDDELDRTLSLEPDDGDESLDTDPDPLPLPGNDEEFSLGEAADIPSSIPSPAGVDSRDDIDDIDELFDSFSAEPSDSPGSIAAGTSAPGDLAEAFEFDDEKYDSDELSPESPATREINEKAARPTLDDTFDNTAELDGTAVIDVDGEELAEFQASIPAEDYDTFEEQAAASLDNPHDGLHQDDDDLGVLLDGVYPPNQGADDGSSINDDDLEAILTADFTDFSSDQSITSDDESDPLADVLLDDGDGENKSLEPFQAAVTDHDDTDRFMQELERQADEMTGERSDVVASTTPAQPDIGPAVASQRETAQVEDTRSHDVDDTGRHEADSEISTAAFAAAGGATAAGAAAAASAHAVNPGTVREPEQPAVASAGQGVGYPIDLVDSGTGTRYTVYRRDQSMKAVKSGVSWSALFLTIPFLIYRQLFGTAIVYTIMSAILLAGLFVMGLAWYDAGRDATQLVKMSTIAFGLLAIVGLLYMPFRYGNQWRGEKLEDRGFELVAWVRASNPGKAITQVRREAALD